MDRNNRKIYLAFAITVLAFLGMISASVLSLDELLTGQNQIGHMFDRYW